MSGVGFHLAMSLTPTQIRHETTRRWRRLNLHLGEDVRRIRLDAHLSIADLGRAIGIDDAHLGRIEAGQAHPSTEVLTAIGVALGADLSIRYFPGSGPRIHDRFQAPMVETLIRSLHQRWRVELEVPVSEPARGVIDAVLRDRSTGLIVATEVQSDLQRLEQQIRWGHEKAVGLAGRLADAGSSPSVFELLILRSTVRTRDLARQYAATLHAAFPARTADAYDSLTAATSWPGSAIVWMHVHGSTVTLMRFPPRGVEVGR